MIHLPSPAAPRPSVSASGWIVISVSVIAANIIQVFHGACTPSKVAVTSGFIPPDVLRDAADGAHVFIHVVVHRGELRRSRTTSIARVWTVMQ